MSDIKQGISDFYRVAKERDFSRDFQLRVINFQVGGGENVSFEEDDLVYIKTANLPGRNLTNNQASYMGMPFNYPGSPSYPGADGWQITFYCDQNSRIRRLCESIQFNTFDDETSTGNYALPGDDQVIDLVQLDTQMNPINRYQLVGAWIQTIGDLQYNIAEGQGQAISFDATMSYQFWRPKAVS